MNTHTNTPRQRICPYGAAKNNADVCMCGSLLHIYVLVRVPYIYVSDKCANNISVHVNVCVCVCEFGGTDNRERERVQYKLLEISVGVERYAEGITGASNLERRCMRIYYNVYVVTRCKDLYLSRLNRCL